jgi:hypothetical protein
LDCHILEKNGNPGMTCSGMTVVSDSGLNAVFATTGKSYRLPRTMVACSDSSIKIMYTVKNFKKTCQRTEMKTLMTDNLKVKASKAVDDARVTAHAVYDNASVAAHNTLKDISVEAQKVSDDVQIGVHKAVADAKIAVHEAGSKMKKR